jgi:hypothetical protein
LDEIINKIIFTLKKIIVDNCKMETMEKNSVKLFKIGFNAFKILKKNFMGDYSISSDGKLQLLLEDDSIESYD